MNENLMLEIVGGIMEAADELLAVGNRNDVENGQLMAYAESLCIIQDALSGYDLKKYGLDFDVDAKYLK